MKHKIRLPDITILMAVASTTLYIVFRNLPLNMGTFAYLWAPLALLTIIITRPSMLTGSPIRILLLYGLIMVGVLQYTLWRFMDYANQNHILFEFYFIVVMLAILYYYRSKGEFRNLALLSKWSFIFIIISLITTNIALFLDPEVVRASAATSKFTAYQEKIYKLTGAMGYSYVQGIICIIPILIYHIKSKKKMVFKPIVLLIILLMIIITEIRSQVFANILVSILVTILSFIWSKKRLSFLIFVFLVGILIVLVPISFYSSAFYSLSTNFKPDSELNNKLNDFSVFIERPEIDNSTEVGSRAGRYPMLFEAFVAHPISGFASHESHLDITLGGHLYWMNRLAIWGIAGFLYFIFVLYIIFKSISSLFDTSFRFYYYISLSALLLMGLTKAVGGRESWLILIVVIPGIYFLPLLQQTKKSKAIQKTMS
jgi:hypothetical protein